MDSVEVVHPVTSLLSSASMSPTVALIVSVAEDESANNLASFITSSSSTSEFSEESVNGGNIIVHSQQSPPVTLSSRQAYQEMRRLGDALTCDSRLSSGERVGEFLLVQWLAKNRR